MFLLLALLFSSLQSSYSSSSSCSCMDLQLGLSLPSFHSDENDHHLFTSSFPHSHQNKRSFSDDLLHHHHHSFREEEAEDDDVVLLPTTLPLLPLTPSHEAYLDDDLHPSSSTVTKHDGDDGGESAAVEWPPLMSQRKKLRFDHEEEDDMAGMSHKPASTESNSAALYVKVRMEGEGIGRKVDLSLHHSFHKLKQTLISMFGKCNDHSESYDLAYQDREGDWLLAEDLPWNNFLQCAQRLKLVKRTI